MKNKRLSRLDDISLKYKLIIVVSALFVVFACTVNYMTFANARKYLLNENLNLMIANLTQINSGINYNAKHSEVSLNSFSSADRLKQTLSQQNVENRAEFIDEIKLSLLSFKSSTPNVVDLKIFTYNENLPTDDFTIFHISKFKNTSLLEEIVDMTSGVDTTFSGTYTNTVWSNIGDGTWNKFGYIPSVYCFTVLYDDSTLKPLAVLRMDVTMESVFSGLEAEKEKRSLPGEFFVANANANIIYSSAGQRLRLNQYKARVQSVVAQGDEEGYFLFNSPYESPEYICYQKNNLDWYTIYRIPTSTLFSNITQIGNYTLVTTLTFLCATVAAAILLIYISTKRLLVLSSDISRFNKDNPHITLHVSGRDEIGQVASGVKDMLYEIDMLLTETNQQKEREKELLNENYSKELMRREAEFKALQMQINPHFLYNTLETIKGLVYSDDPETNIIMATQALANLFRYNMNTSFRATLQEEVDSITAYLTIQNFRFDKRILLHNRLPVEIMETPIVRFTLEPLVENCIVHGFKSIDPENNIYLESERIGDTLCIYVRDDGIGMEREKLEEISLSLKHGVSKQGGERSSIGLQNVDMRLKHFYGEEYGLEIESKKGEGATLVIRIPYPNGGNRFRNAEQ